MEIKQLEYFRAIVDEGTISGAARALHMTQPPLSYQMKMLEEELQVRLFARGSKHIRLTEAGSTVCAGRKSSDHDGYYEKRSDQSQPGNDDPSWCDAIHGEYDGKISGKVHQPSSGYSFCDP